MTKILQEKTGVEITIAKAAEIKGTCTQSLP